MLIVSGGVVMAGVTGTKKTSIYNRRHNGKKKCKNTSNTWQKKVWFNNYAKLLVCEFSLVNIPCST